MLLSQVLQLSAENLWICIKNPYFCIPLRRKGLIEKMAERDGGHVYFKINIAGAEKIATFAARSGMTES